MAVIKITIDDRLLKEFDHYIGNKDYFKGKHRSKAISDAMKMFLKKPVYIKEKETIRVASLCDCQNLSKESKNKLKKIQNDMKTLNKTDVFEELINNYGGKFK